MSYLLGAIFAVLLGIMTLPNLVTQSHRASENSVNAIAAQQAVQFNQAVSAYIKAYSPQVEAVTTATTPLAIPVQVLKNVNLLPATFNATTPFGGNWQAQVLQPSAGDLQILNATTGGEAIPDNRAKKIANLIGNTGGFIPKNDTGLYVAGNAYGTSWGPLPTTNYTVSGGQLASYIYYSHGQLTDGQLYRNAVPGQPQLNTMNTPILMGATTIQAVWNPCPTNGAIGRDIDGRVLSCVNNKWKKAAPYWEDPVSTYAALPTCDAISVNQTRIVETPTSGTGRRAYTCNGAGSWEPLGVDDAGNLTVSGTATIDRLAGNLVIDNVVSVGASCPQDGGIARTATNTLVICRNGLWSPSDELRYTQYAVYNPLSSNRIEMSIGTHRACFVTQARPAHQTPGVTSSSNCAVWPDSIRTGVAGPSGVSGVGDTWTLINDNMNVDITLNGTSAAGNGCRAICID